MENVYITFRSVTTAQRGEQVLRAGGIRSKMQRTPRWMEEQGCGYCLVISGSARQNALERLRRAQVPYRRCYVPNALGVLEELP